MLITIAIPTYNNEKTIAKAIISALEQDYTGDYEILIANNASKDKTQEVIDSFKDDKIRVVTNEETYDMYTNHNICLKEAKGDYVLFCHSDDELLPNALSIVSCKICERKTPNRYILWGHSVFRDFFFSIERGGQTVNMMFSGEAAIKSFLCGGLSPSGTCYSKKTLLGIGGFPVIDSRSPEMDWAVLIIAAFNYFEFEMIDRILIKRIEASTAISSISRKEWSRIHRQTMDLISSEITPLQMEFFVKMIVKYGPFSMQSSVRRYFSYINYFTLLIKRLFK